MIGDGRPRRVCSALINRERTAIGSVGDVVLVFPLMMDVPLT